MDDLGWELVGSILADAHCGQCTEQLVRKFKKRFHDFNEAAVKKGLANNHWLTAERIEEMFLDD